MAGKGNCCLLGLAVLTAVLAGCQNWKNHSAYQGGPPTASGTPKRHWGRKEVYPEMTVATPSMITPAPPVYPVVQGGPAGPPPAVVGPPPVVAAPPGPPATPAVGGPSAGSSRYSSLSSTGPPTTATNASAAAGSTRSPGAADAGRRRKPAADADVDEFEPPRR